jgi:hypothetical protein
MLLATVRRVQLQRDNLALHRSRFRVLVVLVILCFRLMTRSTRGQRHLPLRVSLPLRVVTPTPSPSVPPTECHSTPSPSVPPTEVVTPTPTPSVPPTRVVTPTPPASVTPPPVVTPTPTVSITPTPTEVVTPTPTPSVPPTEVVTPTPTPSVPRNGGCNSHSHSECPSNRGCNSHSPSECPSNSGCNSHSPSECPSNSGCNSHSQSECASNSGCNSQLPVRVSLQLEVVTPTPIDSTERQEPARQPSTLDPKDFQGPQNFDRYIIPLLLLVDQILTLDSTIISQLPRNLATHRQQHQNEFSPTVNPTSNLVLGYVPSPDQLFEGNDIQKTVSGIEEMRNQEFGEYLGIKGNLPEEKVLISTSQQTLKNIAQQTGKRSGIIYIVSRADRLELILVPPVGQPIHYSVPEANRAALFPTIQEFRKEITNRAKRDTTTYLPASPATI